VADILPLPERWDGGLREDLPPSAIKPPFAEIAQDVGFNETTGPTSKPGFTKINSNVTAIPALRMNGLDTVLWIDRDNDGPFDFVPADSNWTISVEFTIRRFGRHDVFIFEWSENVAHTYGLRMIVEVATKNPKILISDAAGAATAEVTLSETLAAGTKYRFSASRSRVGDGIIYGRIDSGSWQGGTSFSGNSYLPSAPRGIIIGGAMDSDTNLSTINRLSPLYRVAALDVHGVFYHRSFQTEGSGWVNLHFSGMPESQVSLGDQLSPVSLARIVRMGVDGGVGVERYSKVPKGSTASWNYDLRASPLVGDSSLVFDGISDFIAVPNAFLYMRPIRGEDGEFTQHRDYAMLVVVDPENNDCTLMKFSPVDTLNEPFTPDTRFYMKLGIDVTGKPYVSASYFEGAVEKVHTVTAVSAYTDKVLIYGAYIRDENQADPSLRLVISASDDVVTEDITTAFPGAWTAEIPVTQGHEFDDRSSKYSLILGGESINAKFHGVENDADDPDDFLLSMNHTKMFRGQMDQVLFIVNEDPSYGAGELEDEKIISFRYREWTTQEIVAESVDQRILSYWKFNEGEGQWVTDYGLLGNDIFLNEDPAHTYVEGDLIDKADTEDYPNPPIDGIFEYFRALAAGRGEDRKLLALSGGVAYEVDEANEQLTKLDEGYRNDDQEGVVGIEYQNDLLIASGDYPFRISGDEIFRVGLETFPKRKLAWSILNQTLALAEIGEGTYRYRVVFYSSVTREEGDWSNEIKIRVRKGNVCSIGFGSIAEDDAVNFGTIYPGQQPAILNSPLAEPFDITNGVPGDFSLAKMNVQVICAGGGQTYEVKIYREDVNNPESVSAREIANVMNEVMERASVTVKGDVTAGGKIIRIFSSPVGHNGGGTQQATLIINPSTDVPSYGTGERSLAFSLGGSTWNGTNITALGSDAGISKRPLPLALDSPQATHIRFYRTVADGGTFYLAGETQIGMSIFGYAGGQYWIDNVSDDDLVFQPGMDDRKGRPPRAKDLAELGGRVFYVDADFPYRLWWSVPGRPHQVEPSSFIDILDGRSLEITNIERYGGSILLTKANATFNLTLTTGPILPFNIELRKPDVGCVGRHAMTNVRNMLFVGGSNHPMSYDSLTYRDIGYQVHETYRSASRDEQKLFVVVHRRQDREVLFADPTGGWVVVYNYGKNSWSKWINQHMRVAKIVELGDERDDVYFGDDLGNVFKVDEDVHNSGGNFVTDATKMNESLTGTGFTISGGGSNVVLTGFTAIQTDTPYVRGLYLKLTNSGGTVERRRILYIDSSDEIVVETAFTVSTDAAGTWAVAAIEERFRSGQIRHPRNNFLIREFSMDMEDLSARGWPDSHNVTIKANIVSGVTTKGEISRTHPVDKPDAVRSLTFRARAWQWEITNLNPDEPFSLNGMAWYGTLVGRGVPLR
jgi:hypothetical protein